MIYLDTSFIAPLFRVEPSSGKVANFISRQVTGSLAVSKWTGVEFASLISRDVHMNVLTTAEGRSLLAEFDSIIAASFVVISPNGYDFELAQEYIAHFSTHLRAPDALNMAVAHNNGMDYVATLDEGMLAAAKKLKVPARRVLQR